MIREITPEEMRDLKVIAVHIFGRKWSWEEFCFKAKMYHIFTENGIWEFRP